MGKLSRTIAGLMLLSGGMAADAQQVRPEYSVRDVLDAFNDCGEGRSPAVAGSDQCAADKGFRMATNPLTPRKPAANRSGTKPSAPVGRVRAARPRGVDLKITFANGSTELTPQAQANAGTLGEALTSPKMANVRFAIDGHTNAVGGRAFNQQLSLARAKALADYLIQAGVDPSRLQVSGFGFDRPANPGDPRAAENRRVEGRRLN